MTTLVLGPENPRAIILFGSGSGGDPTRYRTVLTALADAGYRVLAPTEPRVSSLVLFAPPLGWFHGPGALDELSVPVTVFVGDRDSVTPPATIEVLHRGRGPVDTRILPRAGHFDFMDALPPGIEPDPALDRTVFLRDLGASTVAALAR